MADTQRKASSSLKTPIATPPEKMPEKAPASLSLTSPTSLSMALRQGCQQAHMQIETVPMMAQLSEGMSVSAYQHYLCALYGYYQPLEHQLFGLSPEQRPHSTVLQPKTPWLEHDLLASGLDQQAIAALPRCSQLPVLSSLATAWGVHYVLEGAALGGRVLLRRVSHLAVAANSRFLQGHGSDTGRYWQQLRQAMDSEVTPEQWPASLGSALQTFATLETWLRR